MQLERSAPGTCRSPPPRAVRFIHLLFAQQTMPAQFIKRNQSRYEDQLLREAHGLETLRRAAVGTGIDVPKAIHVDHQSLTLPFIRATDCSAAQWQKLAEGLA